VGKMEKSKVKIVIKRRRDDYHACIEGHPEIWGCGSTYNEAVGNLVVLIKNISQ
jgi:predicted RNase H-like HicB family nuclease